jgi:sphingosine kinase
MALFDSLRQELLAKALIEIDEERIGFKKKDGGRDEISISDLVGSTVVPADPGTWVVCAIVYPTLQSHCGCTRGCVPQPARVRTVHAVASLPSAVEATALSGALAWAARREGLLPSGVEAPSGPPPRRRLLVFLNPCSGPGQGPKLYASHCAPMLADAGCDVDIVTTQRAHEAVDTLQGMPAAELLRYDGVLAGGGDGSLHEVVQGLLGRADGAAIAAQLTIGHIPVGSGNGMAASLCAAAGQPFSISNATLLIAKGQRAPLDIASVYSTGVGIGSRRNSPFSRWGQRRFSFLSTAWGLIADADIESEVLRCTGALRTDIWVALRVLTLRQYRGDLWLLPVHDDGNTNAACSSTASGRVSSSHVDIRAVASGVEGGTCGWPPPPLLLRPFGEPLPSSAGWRKLPGPFVAVWILSTTHQSIGVAAAPESAHDDGVLTVVTIPSGVGRMGVLRLMLSLDGKDFEAFIRAQPYLAQVHRCRAFRIEVDAADPMRRHGHIVVDGEDVGYGDVQGEVHPGLMRIFGPSTVQ